MRAAAGFAAIALTGALTGSAWGYEPVVNYQLHCMGCHLADGSGQSGRVPSIRRSLVLFSKSSQGREYVIRVPGVAQSPLSNEEIAALLNWMVRNLSDLKVPPDFTDYSPAEIQRSRDRPFAKLQAVRARLMRKAVAKQQEPLP